jgi:hypothetical protein
VTPRQEHHAGIDDVCDGGLAAHGAGRLCFFAIELLHVHKAGT